MNRVGFIKTVVGELVSNMPPVEMNTLLAVGDVNRDGFVDLVICGRNGKMVWFRNQGRDGEWKSFLVDEVDRMECGGILADLGGDGYPDIVNGGDYRLDEVYRWENPGKDGLEKDGLKWKKWLVAKTGAGQIHDIITGDITGDGTGALIFTNQLGKDGTTIYHIPIPKDLTVSPWPGARKVAAAKYEQNPRHCYRKDGIQPEEGLAIGDVDGDGKDELVCGTHWYKYNGSGWDGHKFASGYLTTKCAIGDVDGDGRNEIILSEGDPCVYGKTEGGKVSWFKPKTDITGMWEEHVLEDHMLDAHSLQLGDICGNGKLDIFIGEVGFADGQRRYTVRPPRLLVFENNGYANFTRHVIDEGTGTHEALLADTRNRGVLDIIGKPLHGDEMWKIHVWLNNCTLT